ncbi:unnamed protein product [Gadus morhua 'NCC']
MSGLIETMEMLFLLLGFLFFVKGCAGLTLYGEAMRSAVELLKTPRLILIGPPPTPSIETQPLCNVSCALKCTADTTDLGPVSYEWKKDEGEWTEGDALKNISSSDTPEKFFCRLKTRVRTSNTSLPMENPLYKPVPATPDAVTIEPHNPESAGDVSNASLTYLLYLLLLTVPVLVGGGDLLCGRNAKEIHFVTSNDPNQPHKPIQYQQPKKSQNVSVSCLSHPLLRIWRWKR